MSQELIDCPCRKPYWNEARGVTVIPMDLPEAAEAPEGYVVISEDLPTYHRPYRYRGRWMDKHGGFKPSPHCSFRGFQSREWTLVIEAEAYANGLKQCKRCWYKEFPRCEHCGRYL